MTNETPNGKEQASPTTAKTRDTSTPTASVTGQSNGCATPKAKSPSTQDREGVALLKEIFPELTREELYTLHQNHVLKSTVKKKKRRKQHKGDSQAELDEERKPASKLGQRIWRQSKWLEEHSTATSQGTQEPLHWRQTELPEDFLRLSPDVAIRKFNEKRGKWEYTIVTNLEKQVLEQHRAHLDFSGQIIEMPPDHNCYSRVLIRDPKCGLGMTLCEQAKKVWVHSLLGMDGSRWFSVVPQHEQGGPAVKAGIRPGDWLIGINGQALIPLAGQKNVLVDAVSTIRYAPDPIVLHLRRVPHNSSHPLRSRPDGNLLSVPLDGPSLLDTTSDSILDQEESKESIVPPQEQAPTTAIHPFVQALSAKRLIQTKQEQTICSRDWDQFTARARQWESFLSFRLDCKTFILQTQFDSKDLPPSLQREAFDLQGFEVDSVRPYTPSTPTLDPAMDPIPPEYLGDEVDGAENLEGQGLLEQTRCLLDEDAARFSGGTQGRPTWVAFHGGQQKNQKPMARRMTEQPDIFIPLIGVRKALCVRIVNAFLDGDRTAYTVWVYDVEAGREWYAPVRYLKDFQDLRASAIPLFNDLGNLPFPAAKWGLFGKQSEKSDSESQRATKCRQLEHFLRTLATLIYTHQLHPYIAEISIHLQSFLGCSVDSSNAADQDLHLQNHVTLGEGLQGLSLQLPPNGHSEIQTKTRMLLKRAIQRYVFRLFLLEAVQKVVSKFVDHMRASSLRQQDIDALEARGRLHLKERAMKDLEAIQDFLDGFQNMVTEACMDDFKSISQRRDYRSLRDFLCTDDYLDKIVREAVREQIEIEIYVPLRGVVSRLLVNGWRHDDMEIHFKMKELGKRSQTIFRIPEDKQSPSGWASVANILSEGVGMSTLPCAKLRAIVEAAREISRLFGVEHQEVKNGETKKMDLGADDFLPIFIYSVVQAEMERPSALCVLLRTLCDPTNRIGEIGYYLATFEAAVAHIHEIDLTADRDLMIDWNGTS